MCGRRVRSLGDPIVKLGIDALEFRANIRGMTTSAADHYRQNADECGKQAEKASSPQDKERWLKQAEKWLDLAQQAEAVRVGRVQSPDETAAAIEAVSWQ